MSSEGSLKTDAESVGGQASGSRGATDLFGTVTFVATPAEAPPKAAEVVAPPAEPVSRQLPKVHEVVFNAEASGGAEALRQLLRSAAPAAKPAEPTPAPVSNVGFTQLLRALNREAAIDPVIEEPSKPAPLPKPETPAPSRAEPAPAAQENSRRPEPPAPAATSMTQLLGLIDLPAEEAAADAEPDARRAVRDAAEPASGGAVPVSRPAPAGSHTSAFQVTSFSPAKAVAPPVPPPTAQPAAASAAPPVSFTQLFRTANPPAGAPVALPELASPGEFTRLFKAVGPATVEGPPVAAPTSPQPVPTPMPPAAKVPDGPVSFTQMFRTLDAEAGARAAEPAAPRPEVGSFTQMFQTAHPPSPSGAPVRETMPIPVDAAAPPHTPEQAGSFTQMFQALGVEDGAAKAAPRSPGVPPPEVGSFPPMFVTPLPGGGTVRDEPVKYDAEPASFTQMFRTLDAEATPSGGSGAPASAAGASFTQTFGSFSSSSAEPSPTWRPAPVPTPPTLSPARPSQAAAPQGDGLTALLRTLDQPGQPQRSAPEPPRAPSAAGPAPGLFTSTYSGMGTSGGPAPALPPVAPLLPTASGPSEFTRILNASALRESGMREGQAAGPVAQPQASAPSQPWSMPTLPSTPALPQVPSVRLPPVPGAPAAAVPEAATLTKFLPLILILTILLLVGLLVVVVFFLKR